MKITLQKITPAFTDARGDITDILTADVRHTGIITFSQGAVRGNHYHKLQTQYTYMLSGTVELHSKDTTIADAPVEKIVLQVGDLVTIPPLLVHTYVALEPASMLCLTTLSREGSGYEDDTYRVEIVGKK